MNAPDFENLINGNDIAKIMFAPIPENESLENKTNEQIQELIKIHQVEIPADIKNRVRIFVKKLTDQHKAPRYIRRAVMREFNIKVV